MNICIFLNDYSPPWTEGGKNLFREIAQVLSERHKVIFIGVSNKTCVNVIDGNRSFLFRSWGYGSRFHKFSYFPSLFQLIWMHILHQENVEG